MARTPYNYDVDATYYYAMYPDVAAAGIPAARHYHFYGWHEGRNPSDYFDTLGYLTTYRDVAAGGGDPLAHFHNFGWYEGRTPSPAFDPQAYLAANPDVAAAGIDPLGHYLRYGRAEGRQAIAKPLYDADGNANAVTEHSGGGTYTGVTFSWGGFVSPNLHYVLAGDTSGGGFAVDYNSGQVYIADSSKVDYNGSGPSHSYVVTVTASDLGHTISQSATITVANAPPTTPVDSDTNHANAVAEGAATGTYTGLTASASDVGGPVTYSLVGDTSNGGFRIDATTGAVTVADGTKINYETAPGGAYSVTVAASDGTQASTQTFSIAVVDVAPATPADADAAANTVVEGAAAGTTVGVTASSTDVNGPAVTYSIVNDPTNGGFAIDANGVVTVADPTKIDYEASGPGHTYTITVAASDGTLSNSNTFTIAVTNAAPSTPTDADTADNTVVEGAAVNTPVGITASSIDPGNGPAVTYSLTNSANGAFKIDPSSGVISVADPSKIDYESSGANHSYQVTVQASDGSGAPNATSTQTFTIGVTNTAPTAPTDINANANSVAEGAAANTPVGITASSTDINGPAVTYSLVGDTSNGGFKIDPASGVISVANGSKIDYESSGSNHSYDVTVQASDGSGGTSLSTFTIGVTNVAPSAPTDANASPNTVVEGAPAGTSVGITASSSDPGNGPAVTYTLNDPTNGGFAIDANGVITVADPTKIDYETSGAGHAYQLGVTASDGSASTTSTFTVAVTNAAPSTPTDADTAANTVVEGAATNTPVGITASSSDVNGPNVTYSLTNSAGGAFKIDPSSGVISVADPSKIDYESSGANHSYQVTAQASDGSGAANATSAQTFTIAVTNTAPTTPTDINANANSVTEGAAVGTPVGVRASSSDVNGPAVTYAIIGDTSNGGFRIDGASGVISVANPSKIDYESSGPNHSYDVTVQASDGSGGTSSSTFTIGVTNVAPSPPTDTNAAPNTVVEGAPAGTTVGLTASSMDVNGPAVTYTLNDPTNGGFAIDANGVVTVADPTKIDYETSGPSHAYQLGVTASDGSASTTSTFTVAVTNAPPTAPTDANTAANTVVEGAATDTLVGITASSMDPGNGPNVTYSLTNSANGAFKIDPSSGVISVANGPFSNIDYESSPGHSYQVTVRASDGNGGTSSSTFTIGVTDAPPSTPTDADASPNQTSSNAAPGSPTGVRASSTDPGGGTVSYELFNDDGGHFRIDPATGVVTVGATAPVYDPNDANANIRTITVQATDPSLMSTTQDFQITIVENAPPVAKDDATTATEGGGTNNTGGSDPSGNVVTGAGGHGEVADTDDQGTANLTVVAVGTGAENSPDNGTVGTSLVSANGYGTLTLAASGNYTYTVNQTNAAVQALNVGAHLTDTFHYTIKDAQGATDSATITVTINGANDAAVISGTKTGTVIEQGSPNNAGNPTATGTLTDTDVDNTSPNTFTAVTTPTASANGYGTYTMTAGGTWTYTLDNTNPTVNALGTGTQTTDTFTVTTVDGTPQAITITINGSNDAPTANNVTATGYEDQPSTAHPGPITVTLGATDPDTGDSIASYKLTSLPSNGTLYTDSAETVAAAANTAYTSNTFYFKPTANYSGTTSFNYTATDTHQAVSNGATATIDINPVADMPSGSHGDLTPTPAGGQAEVNTTTGGGQNHEKVTALSGGGYAIAWQDTRTHNIQARIYNASGTAQGNDFALTASNGTVHYDSSVVSINGLSGGTHAGGFVEIDAAQTLTQSGNNAYQIEGRFVSATGTVGPTFAVSAVSDPNVTGELGPASSAVFANGSFVAVWCDLDPNGDNSVLYAQRFDAAGNPVHQDGITGGLARFQIGPSSGVQLYPDVATLDNGNFVVTWEGPSSNGSDTDTYFQVFNSAGGTVMGPTRMNESTQGPQHYTSVTALQGGGFSVSWDSYPNFSSSDGNIDVYTRVYDANGNPVTDEIRGNTVVSGIQEFSNVVGLADGGYLLTWYSGATGTQDIRGQRFDAAGHPLGGEFGINTTLAGVQFDDANTATVLNSGQVVSVWFNTQTDAGDIYARVLNLPGDGAQGTTITLTTFSAMVSDTVGTSPTNGGQETIKELDLSGFPAGSTFSLGHAGSGGIWVIDAADFASLRTTPLTITPPAGYPAAGASGAFTLNVSAVVTDTATLSTGTVTDTHSYAVTSIPVGVKAPGDPIFAADTAGVTALHLDGVAPGDSVTFTKIPGNGDILLGDGTAVHEGQTLSAGQFASLAFRPVDTGHDTSAVLQFTVSDGKTTTASTIPVYVAHGSGLTMNGSTGTDHIIGSAAADTLVGHGGQDVLTGGGGADHFVFDQTSIAGSQAARITDYDVHQGAVIDVTAITKALGASGQDAAAAFHVQEDAGGASATLSVNTGTAQAPHWAEIAHLDGLHAGADVDLAVDPAHPGATAHLHVDAHAVA